MIKKIYKVTDKKLDPLTKTDIPSYFLLFDTETKFTLTDIIERHEFHIGWSCLWNRKADDIDKVYDWQFWDDATEMCQYFHDTVLKLGKVVLVAHNIYFDLQVSGFFEYFTKKKYKVRFIYDHQSAYILKCSLNGKQLIALSTTNYFDQPLKEIGKILDLPKLDIDLNDTTPEALKVYCRRDVEILVKAMEYYIDFIKDNNLGKFSYSKAAQAFTAYRFRFMTEKIRIHTDQKAVKLERSAYLGGRTECFYIGHVPRGTFMTLDINSMYPYVMTQYKYPYQLIDYVEKPTIEHLKRVLTKFAVISSVNISTKEPAFAIPYNKKTVFPVGQFKASLCSESLKYALDNNMITSVNEMSVYKQGDLFTEYMKYFHALKVMYGEQGNKIMVTLTKYMLNSLYGKWGQKYQIETRKDCFGVYDYYRDEILDMRTGRLVIKTWLMNQLIIRSGEKEGKYSLVAIAAHVTDNARLLLWNIIKGIGLERVLYCDTDSVKIRSSDLKYVKWPINPNQLGALKIEDTCNSLFIGGNKYYVTEKNTKIKGIPKNAKEISPGVYEFFSWPKMTYHLREGIIKGYHRKQIKRRVTLNYDKGIVTQSGRVVPFSLTLPS